MVAILCIVVAGRTEQSIEDHSKWRWTGEGTVDVEPDREPDEERSGRAEAPSPPETEWEALGCAITARYGKVLENLGD
jgi:hypothetical protein